MVQESILVTLIRLVCLDGVELGVFGEGIKGKLTVDIYH